MLRALPIAVCGLSMLFGAACLLMLKLPLHRLDPPAVRGFGKRALFLAGGSMFLFGGLLGLYVAIKIG